MSKGKVVALKPKKPARIPAGLLPNPINSPLDESTGEPTYRPIQKEAVTHLMPPLPVLIRGPVGLLERVFLGVDEATAARPAVAYYCREDELQAAMREDRMPYYLGCPVGDVVGLHREAGAWRR